ncbi:MAG: C_GCAxxG_C_C family protein [Bacteroidales bacterium]|nr:C_GCAxxG_C_C family protein [Bacteroidales bacterium]
MDRRTAMKITAGAIAGGGSGVCALANAFIPESRNPVNSWKYYTLDPAVTARLSYKYYEGGMCMYSTFRSVISQLADRFGEPYSLFPFHMMKYGHGGVGGYGTICGALNGAAAVIGLFVENKTSQDRLISGLLKWYEETKLPEFKPESPILDFNPPPTVPGSTMCHASVANWVTETGYQAKSDERKERCRRLTSDVVSRVTVVLNEYFGHAG